MTKPGTASKPTYDQNMARKIAKSEAKIIHIADEIHEKRRQMIKLKMKQETERNKHFAKTRLKSWRTMYEIVKMPDSSLRPPDKTFNVRAYSNMDRDMWDGGSRGETLRGWFQKFAEIKPRTIWQPEQTSYLVKNSERVAPSPNVMQVKHYESRILNRSPYNVPEHPAGQYFSLPSDHA
ncbi:hypothetical protein TrLO_g6499 [Triparma laevis f. longispina]|uniref:Uncharacterized protein n=2 Tax=Triparma laevis TaxID=1534972 RepID=A0A9W7CGR4_9STRA|nr:hypothetical protein TrLO_g6499 [Triparma laevis f. longispina]